MKNIEERLDEVKNMLGNMGIDILFAIDNGARDLQTIKIISDLPIACIKGRIPVLLDLGLIKLDPEGYILTNRGLDLKVKLAEIN